MRPRVLVTGFGPFPGAPENPSQVLIQELRRTAEGSRRRYELDTAVLPTRYDAAREAVLRLHRRLKPDIALHFGFSLKAKGFTLERVAENRLMSGRLDAGGARPARAAVRQGGPLASASTLPLARIHAALCRQGLPAVLSDDAGGYVCNLVFYAAAARRREVMTGFIHIPLLAEMKARPHQKARGADGLCTMPRSQLVNGARVIIQTCLEAWRAVHAPASHASTGLDQPTVLPIAGFGSPSCHRHW